MTMTFTHRSRIESLDPVEQSLLPVFRYFLLSFQDNDGQGWRLAFSVAAETWGEARGLAIAHRAQTFLSALLQNRAVPFQSADPLCLKERAEVTKDEADLLALLSHMRADETGAARNILRNLVGERCHSATVKTGLQLCDILECRQQNRCNGSGRPRTKSHLRVVS